MLDDLIQNAAVFNGDHPDPRTLSVGLRGGRIAYVGEALGPGAARREVDGRGLFLCPGFIDTHASTGFGYRLPHAGDNKLYQGVTTEVIGNCGTSPGPVGERYVDELEALAEDIGFVFDWRTLGEWMAGVEAHGLPFNIGVHVGHSTLRSGTCEDAAQVTDTEIDAMEKLLEGALDDGALGLSTGLVYAPGSFAETSEIVRLARAVARRGGIYVSHIRDERQGLETSIDEAIRIGEEGGLPVLVSHLKAAEKPNWGKIPKVLRTLEEARARGTRISFEVYPYTAVSTKLSTFIPKAALADGLEGMARKLRTAEWRGRTAGWLVERGTDFDAMALITESLPGARGRSVAEIAAARGTDPGDAVVDLLLADPTAWIVYDCMDQADLDAAVLWPSSIVCSDSWSYPVNAPHPIGDPHPRTYGAFTRFLERWSLREERLPFGEAVRKITSLPADWLGLTDRGRIRPGAWADLVLLDPDQVREKATYADPRRFSEGTRAVWVGGTRVLEQGELLVDTPLAGRVLRRGDRG